MATYFWSQILKATPTLVAPLISMVAFVFIVPHIKHRHFHCSVQKGLFLCSSFSPPSMVLFLPFTVHAALASPIPLAVFAFSAPSTPLPLLSFVFLRPFTASFLRLIFEALLGTAIGGIYALHHLRLLSCLSNQFANVQSYFHLK